MGFKRIFAAAPALPTTATRGGRAARRRFPTGQGCRNHRLTILCGVITVLVFRGTIGISWFASMPEIGSNNYNEETDRVIAQIRADDEDDDSAPTINFNGTYSLGPKIDNWDSLRQRWLQDNHGFPNYVKGKPKILLVTESKPGPCSNPIGDHYLLKAIKNKIDYCRLHNIKIVYNMANLDVQFSGNWAKLPIVRKLMFAHPEVEWIWWMDSDAFFTDMFFEIPISKYDSFNMVVHGFPNLLFDEKSWTALNTGSFLLRNCEWSMDFLDSWAQMGPKGRIRKEAGKILTANLKGRPSLEADEQSALIYLLISRRDEWMDGVFLENSYFLHGYWTGLVDRYEENIQKFHPGFGDERWPFVTHFVGCKPCGGIGDYALEMCLRSMERAFNFADNQLLELYGFSHRGLSSPNVKRIRNETTRPLEHSGMINIRTSLLEGSASQN